MRPRISYSSGIFIFGLCVLLLVHGPKVQAQQQQESGGTTMKEFMMACTYGVLAGTLVGAASLAFTDQPGDNLNRVARGASIGLYTGILLGVYVVYIVPGQIESDLEEQQRELLQEPGYDDLGAAANPIPMGQVQSAKRYEFAYGLAPTFSEDQRAIDGAQVNFSLRF